MEFDPQKKLLNFADFFCGKKTCVLSSGHKHHALSKNRHKKNFTFSTTERLCNTLYFFTVLNYIQTELISLKNFLLKP